MQDSHLYALIFIDKDISATTFIDFGKVPVCQITSLLSLKCLITPFCC